MGNSPISLRSVVVTAAWPNFFYAEPDNRSSGIRVDKPGHGLSIGMRAQISGTVTTNADGERCIAATSASQSGFGLVAPLGMNNRALGGGTCGYQSGVYGWIFVRDSNGKLKRVWSQSSGLNNIGLLISTWGRVTHSDGGWFYIDDGSHLDDGSGYVGIRVYSGAKVQVGQCVIVTGISGCELSSSGLIRVLRVADSANVLVLGNTIPGNL